MGQSRAITGDAWVQVYFDDPKNPGYTDPFGEYPEGRVRINVLPSTICFPEFTEDQQRKDEIESFTIIYPVEPGTMDPNDDRTRLLARHGSSSLVGRRKIPSNASCSR